MSDQKNSKTILLKITFYLLQLSKSNFRKFFSSHYLIRMKYIYDVLYIEEKAETMFKNIFVYCSLINLLFFVNYFLTIYYTPMISFRATL